MLSTSALQQAPVFQVSASLPLEMMESIMATVGSCMRAPLRHADGGAAGALLSLQAEPVVVPLRFEPRPQGLQHLPTQRVTR